MTKRAEDLAKTIPNPTLRADSFDLFLEARALLQYRNWIEDVGKAAAVCGDLERKRFYDGLHRVVEEDAEMVPMEFLKKHAECFPSAAVSTEAPQWRSSPIPGSTSSINSNSTPITIRHHFTIINHQPPTTSRHLTHTNSRRHSSHFPAKTPPLLHHPPATSHHSPLPLATLSLTNLAFFLLTPRSSHLTLKITIQPHRRHKSNTNHSNSEPDFQFRSIAALQPYHDEN